MASMMNDGNNDNNGLLALVIIGGLQRAIFDGSIEICLRDDIEARAALSAVPGFTLDGTYYNNNQLAAYYCHFTATARTRTRTRRRSGRRRRGPWLAVSSRCRWEV